MVKKFAAELVGTLVLVLFGCGAAVLGGFDHVGQLGIALAVIHIVGIQVTGVSVNPARSFGPALLVGGQALSQVWVFFVAPAIGAVIGGLLFRAKLLEPDA